MQFKELDWKDSISDGVIVCSNCKLNICGWINIEFCINHEPDENKYYLYSFGKGNIRRLQPELFVTVDEAKTAAYGIYNNEMCKIKKAIDSFQQGEH
ncbi:MAG: hypothetical protein ACI4EA_09560 [Candidatus Ornithomonoglobus sp.]